MSSLIENSGRLRAPLTKGAALFALALWSAGPLWAQTGAPLFDDPLQNLLEERGEAPRPGRAPPAAPTAVPFEPSPESRFQNRPAAPAAPAAPASAPRVGAAPAQPAAPAANLGFSAQPTRLDAQSLGQVGAQVGARGEEIVQGAAQRWGLSPATLYMLGALLGLLGLLLLARLFGFGQKPARPVKKKTSARRAAARAQEPLDDWNEDPAEEEAYDAPRRRPEPARRAAPAAAERPKSRRPAAPVLDEEGWAEDWGDDPEAAPRSAAAARAARAPRRPNLDRLAASIRETWPGKAGEGHGEAHHEAPVSPARAAAARVAREFAAEAYEPDYAEEAPAPRRPSRSAPRGGGDFLDALEAAGEGDSAALDRVRPLSRTR